MDPEAEGWVMKRGACSESEKETNVIPAESLYKMAASRLDKMTVCQLTGWFKKGGKAANRLEKITRHLADRLVKRAVRAIAERQDKMAVRQLRGRTKSRSDSCEAGQNRGQTAERQDKMTVIKQKETK